MINNEILAEVEKINYWKNLPKLIGIIRSEYLHFFEHLLGNRLIKVLAGQRRAGKSTLMKQFIYQLIDQKKVHPSQILYLNFENQIIQMIQDADSLYQVIKWYLDTQKPTGTIYFFFDEIQEIQAWEKTIVSFAGDDQQKIEIFITGSNSTLLSTELGTYLTGRYLQKDVYPFSFQEYCQFHQVPENKESFLIYLQTTGIAEVYYLQTLELKTSFISTLKDSILLKDIIKRYRVLDAQLLEILFKFLIDNIGNLFSYNSMVLALQQNGFKTNTNTLSNYIKHLEDAFLVFSLNRYDVQGKKILEGEKKYYLTDLGFKTYLSSSYDPRRSKLLENYVAILLKRKGYSTTIGRIQQQEIDFIAEKKDIKCYIQVAYLLSDESVIEREYSNLEKIRDHWEKIVVSLDDIPFGNRNGIRHIQAWRLEEVL